MTTKIRLKMYRGWRSKLLFQSGVRDDLARRARRVQAAAGSDYEVDVRRGKNRHRAQVRTVSAAASRREAETRRLLRSLDAGRG